MDALPTSTLAARSIAQLAAIIDSAGDAVVGKYLDGTIFSWNAGAERLFGYPAEEILGQSVRVLLPVERQDEEAAIIASVQHGHVIRHFETVRVHKDGHRIDVSVSISPIRDADGRIIGASKIARDITELVDSRRRERHLAGMVQAAVRAHKAMNLSLPVATLFERVCQACVEHGEVEAAWVLERTGSELRIHAFPALGALTSSTLPLSPSAIDAALDTGECAVLGGPGDGAGPATALVPFRFGDADRALLVLRAGRADHFNAAVLDVLRELVTDLSDSLARRFQEQEFQGIFESAMDAIIAVDSRQRIRRFNRAAAELFRWPVDQALGQPLDALIPAEARAAHAELVERFGGSAAGSRRMASARSVSGVRADGTAFPIEASVSRFEVANDRRMTAIVRDVSALRAAEAAEHARVVAESANEAKSAFLAQVSHELRTPLNAVLGFAELLLESSGQSWTGEDRARLGHIRSAARHLHVLLSDLLDVARIETAQLRVQVLPVDAESALAEVCRAAELLARARDVRIDGWTLPIRPCRVMADATRLRQVLFNLMSNAVKYNRPGGRIWIEAESARSSLTLTICDTGSGMTEEQLASLFEPFNRLGREHGDIEGVGLGMFISRRLVDLMGGRLTVSSEPAVGTRVAVTLPLASDAAAGKAWRPEPGPVDRTKARGVVLSVEDDATSQLLLEALFARWPNVLLLHAATGAEGLRLARLERPDLVLLDMHLGDMDGFGFLDRLGAEPELAGLAVVALTGSDRRDLEAHPSGARFMRVLTKPVDTTQLEALIDERLLGTGEGGTA